MHFGKGQTEAALALTPGEHVLSLQFADGIHRSYGSALSASIKITTAGTGTLPATAKQAQRDRGRTAAPAKSP